MKWFKIKKPKDPAEQFKGKTLTCYPTAQDATKRTNGEELVVEHIAGNFVHQTMFQVNGSHLVSMLDAYCELNRESLPDQQTHEDFLSTTVEHITRAEKRPTLIDRTPSKSVWAGTVGQTIDSSNLSQAEATAILGEPLAKQLKESEAIIDPDRQGI